MVKQPQIVYLRHIYHKNGSNAGVYIYIDICIYIYIYIFPTWILETGLKLLLPSEKDLVLYAWLVAEPSLGRGRGNSGSGRNNLDV